MNFSDYLSAEWRASLGCTEPAAIAYAACLAAGQQRGEVRLVRLVCDARTFKNCHSVGIPNSDRRTGLLWTLAIGAHLPDHSLELRCFEQTNAETLQAAGRLLDQKGIHVEVDSAKATLHIDVTVVRETGTARVVLSREHTHVSFMEVDGREIGGAANGASKTPGPSLREKLAGISSSPESHGGGRSVRTHVRRIVDRHVARRFRQQGHHGFRSIGALRP